MTEPNATMGKFRDWMLLIVCNLIWASQPTLVEMVQSDMGPVFATFFPILIATLLLIPIVAWEKRKHPETKVRATRKDFRDFILLGVLGQVVAQFFITWGTRPGWSPAANTSLLFLTLPISTSLMAFFILGERMTRVRWISFALAIAGVGLCSGVDWEQVNMTSGKYFWGNVLIFLSVNGSAFYNVYSKKVLGRYSPLQVMLNSYYALLAFMLPVLYVAEPQGLLELPHFGFRTWCGLLILAVLVYALVMIIFLNVLTRLDATQAGLSNYLLPFFGVLIAAVVLHQRLTLPMICGGLLVLGSTLLITVYEELLPKRPVSRRDECRDPVRVQRVLSAGVTEDDTPGYDNRNDAR